MVYVRVHEGNLNMMIITILLVMVEHFTIYELYILFFMGLIRNTVLKKWPAVAEHYVANSE